MKRVKGCLNRNCKAYKKIYYSEYQKYCNKCGEELSFVCKNKKCFKKLPNDTKDAYCPMCQEEHDKKKEKNMKIGAKVATVLTVAASIIVPFIKK